MVKRKSRSLVSRILNLFGPGLTTGAADDDPSGIATYSQTGAQFGFKLLWTALYMLPLMIAVQEVCARIGIVKGKGIAAVIKEYYNKNVLYVVIILVVVANTINIGADIGAMAEAAALLMPLPLAVLTLLLTSIILFLEIFTTYKIYSHILKWLSVSLLAYPATVILIDQPWGEIIKSSLIPHLEFSASYLFILVGVLGTTISPYMFFWQASQEAEEKREHNNWRLGPSLHRHIKEMYIDNGIGMLISELSTWCILIVSASVLNSGGTVDIKNAADAAKALEPLVHTFPYAGFFAKLIFSIGVLGLGLLAIPILSGSAAYAVSEAFNWNTGLNKKIRQAHGFYGVLTIATLIGLTVNFFKINPVKALVYSAVLNGIAAVPLLFIIGRIGRSEKIMGKYKSGRLSQLFFWLTFLLMTAASVCLIYTTIRS